MTKVSDIIQKIEEFAPLALAEDWDPVGLSFGRLDHSVNKVFVALDLDEMTLAEAKSVGADFIFTHHPLIFKAPGTLNEEDAKRRLYAELIRQRMSLYSAHTNLDAARNGMNDWLAESLNLSNIQPMLPSEEDSSVGLGRVGELEQTYTLAEYLEHLKSILNLDLIRYNYPADFSDRIKKVALLGGSGESYYQAALKQQADLYITGDISYHGAQDMLRDDLAFADVGHYVENIFVEKMTELLRHWNVEEDWNIEIVGAEKQRDVFKFI